MKTKTIVFKEANDLYEFNRQAERCKTDIRVKTQSGTFDFDAKTLLGLFFALNLPSIDVYYEESEKEFDEYLSTLEQTEELSD
ncbi:hypothetical protein [Anaerocolumna xylanovorans]|uniref:PTS HPr component phosphorylation site n=1 Tax=Anaerocolumna xylanovorans DSM 12503 TaxID=1121345 RepID=A0A1M7YK20_9FIRM|nr:hypothetical protein [Anaerocolumna xylanovorans]SHO52936.1 hypothetical protein SAMN02745217_03875 [Anaerocolumna xylanovorans DSM 12503]